MHWAKDYKVHLLEPQRAHKSSHLMYSQPVRYTHNELPKERITEIDIITKAEETLISLYKGITREDVEKETQVTKHYLLILSLRYCRAMDNQNTHYPKRKSGFC